MKKFKIIAVVLLAASLLCACTDKQAEADQQTENTVADESTDKEITAQAEESPEAKKEKAVYQKPEMKGEISVNIYEPSEWLETAKNMFEEKYPDLKVNINVFFEGTDTYTTENGGSSMNSRPAGQKREDYIVQLNTQLLSQKADDIVITSVGLPLGRYIKMGIFEDLSGYLEAAEEINDKNYYMNIFDAYKTGEGKLYQLPISAAAIPMIGFDKTLLEHTGKEIPSGVEALSWREALDIGTEIYKASTLPNTFMPDGRTVVGDVFTKAVAASIDYDSGKINIDRDKMIALLDVFEEMKTFKTVPEGFDFYNNEYHIPYSVAYASDVQNAMIQVVEADSYRQWKYDDGKVYLSPYYALDFGITSQSENKELAWEFLRFLVSEEVQTLPSCPNAGVNKKGLQARVEGFAKMSGCPEGDMAKITALVDKWVSQITAYRAEDTDLIQISEGTLSEFMDGKADKEQTIETLISRLEQYMLE